MGRALRMACLGAAWALLAGTASAAPLANAVSSAPASPATAVAVIMVHADAVQAATGTDGTDVHAAGTEVPCTCRAAGRNFDMGETTCLSTPEGLRLARCVMVLNNTSWEIMRTPCPSTRLDGSVEPAG